MWVAFYNDNTCLPQFDLDTGYNHLFKEIDQSKLSKFGWFPISYELTKKLDSRYYHDPNLQRFVLELKPNQRIIALRTEAQHTFDFSHCLKCGFNWQWMPNKPDGSIGDSGLPRYGEKYCYSVINPNNKRIFEVICPKCGAKNNLKCPECDEWWNKIDDNWTLQCPKCKKINEKQVQQVNGFSVDCVWKLGWQETLPDGTNKKMILVIKPDGTFTLGDE
jgi:hypothetical protein